MFFFCTCLARTPPKTLLTPSINNRLKKTRLVSSFTMPLADRPNAPRRLPSADLENSFFRAWALRGSEGSNVPERLQGGSPGSAPTSPVSPFTQVSERKIRSADRKKYFSESNVPRPSPPLRGPPTLFEPSYSPSIIIQEEPSLLKTRASTATSSSTGKISIRSSVSSKARKILGFPNIRASPNATNDGQPPRKAQNGFRWKRETSGHLLEIRIGKKKSNDVSQASSGHVTPIVRAQTTKNSTDYDDRNSILVMESPSPSTPRLLGIVDIDSRLSAHSALKGSSTDPFLSSEYPKEGLYCRTKRVLGLKSGPNAGNEGGTLLPERVMTGEVGSLLDRTSSALRYLASKGRESTNSSTTPSNLSIASPRSMPRWQRLRPGLKHSTQSSSSSLRSLMRGKPPPPSPEPQSMYTGSDNNQYFSVELTKPDAPTFLPSEAHRINTPPLGTPSVSGTNKLHGFFEEYDIPRDAEGTYYVNSNSMSPFLASINSRATGTTAPLMHRSESEAQTNAADVPKKMSEIEWYRVEMNVIDDHEGLSREQFVLSVPEHLPNSPMCPRHPKNKSGGKGVCVYHGRNLS